MEEQPTGGEASRPEGSAAEASEAPPDSDARTMAMLAHLLGVVTGFLGPLLIWLIKKDEHEFIDDQAKEALNFQIMIMIAWMGAGLLLCVYIGILLLPVVAIIDIVLGVMAAVAANGGQRYRYPVNLRLIK